MSLTKLTPEEQANANAIVTEARAKGITNPFSLASLLSIVGKESGFHLKAEGSYRNTSNARIRSIFGDRLKAYSEPALTTLKANDIEFFDVVYGYKSALGRQNGNTMPGDGYKYRGHGYNQTTFKNTMVKIGQQIGVDLLNHPELAETPSVGAKMVVQYFLNTFESGKKLGKLAQYNSTGINDFKTLPDSLNAFYNANAGWGHSQASLAADPTGGLSKARSIVNSFYAVISAHPIAATATGGGLFFLMAAAGFLVYKAANKKKQQKLNTQ